MNLRKDHYRDLRSERTESERVTPREDVPLQRRPGVRPSRLPLCRQLGTQPTPLPTVAGRSARLTAGRKGSSGTHKRAAGPASRQSVTFGGTCPVGLSGPLSPQREGGRARGPSALRQGKPKRFFGEGSKSVRPAPWTTPPPFFLFFVPLIICGAKGEELRGRSAKEMRNNFRRWITRLVRR